MVLQLLAVTSSLYDHPAFKAVLALHILAAMVWVGGGFALAVLGFLVRRRGEPAQAVIDLERAGRLRAWCFAPASLVLIGCGLGLVALGHFSLRALWLDLALGGWFIAFALSLGYLIPESDELSRLSATLGAADARVIRLMMRLRLVGWIETLVLGLVVVDMVLRPT